MNSETTEKKQRKPRASAKERTKPPADAEPVVATAVAEYQPMVAQLGQLKHQLAGVVYDLSDKKQEAAARTDRRLCVTLRTSMAEVHARLKRPIIDRGRELDADLKKITAAILEVEKPIDEQIQALEAERERRAQEKREAEEARNAAIRAEIVRVFSPPRQAPGSRITAAEWREHRDRMDVEEVSSARFPDFTVEAQEAKCAAMEWIAAGLAEARRWEAEQAQLAKQRADLAEAARKQKAEQAEQDAERARQRAIEDAARAEQQEAERKRLAAESERLAAERRVFEAEQAAAREAAAVAAEERLRLAGIEAERIQRERAEREAQEEAERLAAASRAAAEREAVAAAQQRWFRIGPTLLAALETVAEHMHDLPGRVGDVVREALAMAANEKVTQPAEQATTEGGNP